MSALFQFLIAVLLLCGQTLLAATANNDSSSTTESDVFSAASDYVPTSKFNNDNSSSAGINKPTHTRTTTTESDVGTMTVDNVDSLVVSGDNSTAVETDTQTMHADNAARESVHGQNVNNVMDTDNATRESVHGQNAMDTDNATRESVHGQNAMDTDNATRESVHGQNAMDTDNATRESVHGQNAMDTDNATRESVHGQNAMDTDNATRESVHGQNAMDTDNATRESVHGQTTNNDVDTDNVGSEGARGQTVDTTSDTDINVTREVDATSAADRVVSESVAGPGVDSHTLKDTASAMNAGHGESVTAASGDVDSADTVFSSVQNGYNYDDVITAETVFTSTVMTTVVETFSPFITNSPVTPTEDCEAMMCQRDAGYVVINSSACAANDSPTFDTSMPTTVKILTSASSDVVCYWNINVPERNYVSVTIDQLVLEEEVRNVTQILEIYVETDFNVSRVFNTSVLSNRAVTFTSSSTVHFRFRGHDLHLASPITFRFVVERGTIVEDLPVGRLTDAVSYVTSPRFNGLDLFYPNNYDGKFHLHVSHDEFVFISFSHFALEAHNYCYFDYLELTLTALNQTWRKCGDEDIPTRVYHSSVTLFFHSDEYMSHIGFKMMYVILPRSQEPQQLSDNLYNCSVSHFHSFKPLLTCNMIRECQGNEDEEDCGYHSNDCGDGALDAGTKCYRFVRRGVKTTWSDAYYECIQNNQNLVTLATPEEFRRFRQLMAYVRNPRRVYIGAQLVNRLLDVPMKHMYTHLWQWVDGRTAFYLDIITDDHPPRCAAYSSRTAALTSRDCQRTLECDVICEFEKQNSYLRNETVQSGVSISVSSNADKEMWNVDVIQCISGHVTRDFLSCDTQGQCGARESMTSCHSGSVAIAMFVCERSRESLHYSLVCDHIQHCEDNTDEDFCHLSVCPVSWFRCRNGQCIETDKLCDEKSDCYDGSDEVCSKWPKYFELTTLPPAVLYVDDRGMPYLRQTNDSDVCPLTHFQCSQGFCLPIYLRCNGVDDCPNREDEASCESYTCSGFYRCRGSKVCLHADHVCDGVFQCPQYDDELLCEKMACPDVCQCQGLAFVCTANFSASSHPALRYLDASGSGMTPSDLTHNFFLIHLRLSDCRINKQPALELPNLKHLYLDRNNLTHINMQSFQYLKNLRVLVLSGNPLSIITNMESWKTGIMQLQIINFAGTYFDVYNGSALTGYSNLKTLNISGSKLTTIADEGFQSTPLLENLDVRGSPLKKFPSDLLRALVFLKVVHTDNYKLCCEAMLPKGFDLNDCHAEQDLLASCEDLLKSNVFRVFLWLFASLSVVGNVGSFVARLYFSNKGAGLGSFNILVTNLSIADLFMGVYLAIVGVADQIYRGEYLWYDDQWKESTVCKIAGFLSLMSSEVSAFIICLITLDRFLALRFPFSSLHFSRSSALAACAIVWVVGIALATVPLLPVTSHWEFYSQNGICIPLPFTTSERFHGYHYSFSVMIILNFVLFLLIAVGQSFIYWSVRSNSISSSKKTGPRDATIARRLTTIVLSDFLCWFPIGLLGVLASTGTPIPGELNVAVAIFVTPFNSALNPFLYTFNVLMEKRRKAQEANLLKRLESRMHTEQSTRELKISVPVKKSTALELIETWHSEQVLTSEDILLCGSKKDPSQ